MSTSSLKTPQTRRTVAPSVVITREPRLQVRSDSHTRRRRSWVPWTVWFGVLALLFKVTAVFTVADLDMFHEMALFREALTSGWIPRVDVHAFTPTVYPVVHHEWGTGAILYLLAVSAGLGGAGVMALRYVLLAGIVFGAYVCARKRGASGTVLALLAPLAIFLFGHGLSPLRAHMFTFLFLVCLLLLLEVDRKGGRWWLAVWLPLFVVWLNVHAGFLVGAGLLALYALERSGRTLIQSGVFSALRETRHLAAAGAAMVVLVVLANPYGWDYIPYLWHAVRMDRPHIAEWAPLWDSRVQIEVVTGFTISLVLAIYAAWRAGVRQIPGLLLLLATAFFALRSVRILPIYAIVWFCYVTPALANSELGSLIERISRRYSAQLAIAVCALGLVLAFQTILARPWNLRVPNDLSIGSELLHYPVGATDYLAEHRFVGNLMTPFGQGAFVSWKLYPEVKVSFDSRYEVAYPPGAFEEHRLLYAGEAGWRAVLDKYPADAVLVPRQSSLDSLLSHDSGAGDAISWRLVYRDDGFSVFVRGATSPHLPMTDRSGERIVGRFP
jgi:hypothetical protein